MQQATSYEVLDFKEGHWVISFVTDSREEALREAKDNTNSKHVKSVTVVEETTDPNTGKTVASVIYKEGVSDAIPDPIGQKKAYKRQPGAPSRGHAAKGDKQPEQAGKTPGSPKKFIELIDQIKKAVLIFGGLALVLIYMSWYYLSHPEVATSLIDIFISKP